MKFKNFLLLVTSLLLISGVVFASGASESVIEKTPQKVIFDTDMVECFDDGIAMIVLDQTPSIDLLGVTVVAGNRSMPNGVATGVRQLEATRSNTPIYEGSRFGIRNYRAIPENFAVEESITGPVGYAGYMRFAQNPSKFNTVDYDPMAEWKDVYKYFYAEEPVYKNVYGRNHADAEGNDNAVDFIISQVNKYPGEIVIVAVGPLTNIARAILKDPTLPSKVKEIVYMGGSFYLKGNASAAAEFNWWADPDSVKLVLRSDWGDKESESYKSYGNQMISGLEANANTSGVPQDVYDKILEVTYPGIRELFKKKNGTKAPSNIWDVLAVGYVIDPSIVLSWNDDPIPEDGTPQDIYGVYVDINTEMTADYGRSLAYRENNGPAGTKKAAIQNYIDERKFWNEVVVPALTDPLK